MNEEELQWLKEISTTTGISYSGDMTITTDFANKLIDYIKELEQLQNNWNELKKWLEENWQQSQDIWFVKIINKMQELEGNNE